MPKKKKSNPKLTKKTFKVDKNEPLGDQLANAAGIFLTDDIKNVWFCSCGLVQEKLNRCTFCRDTKYIKRNKGERLNEVFRKSNPIWKVDSSLPEGGKWVEMPKNAFDKINKPAHYTQGIECWDYIISHKMPYLDGNIVKYVTRYRHKNGLEDLKKARAYLEKLISQETCKDDNDR